MLVAHQIALSFGLQKFVLYAPRSGLISANKEGIVSLTGPRCRLNCLSRYAPSSDTVNFTGYMAIHLLGLSTGTLILPPTPSYFRRMQQAHDKNHRRDGSGDSQTDNSDTPTNTLHRQNDKTATELFSYAAVWWASMGLTALLGVGGGVSRRMVRSSSTISPTCVLIAPLFDRRTCHMFFGSQHLIQCSSAPTYS